MKEEMWCIIGENYRGKPLYMRDTISYTRKETIEKFVSKCSFSWSELKKYGWTCIKVIITIEPK